MAQEEHLQEILDQQKLWTAEVTAADVKVTRCAGQKRKVQNKDDVSPKSLKECTYEKRLWRSPESKKGTSSRDIEELLHLRKGRTTTNINESMGNSIEVFRNIIGLQLGKLVDGSSVVLYNIKNWTLWRVRPPPKRKRNCMRSKSG
jgi:hypothetical protein